MTDPQVAILMLCLFIVLVLLGLFCQSLRVILEQLIPACGYHLSLKKFAAVRSNYEYGLVSHALASVIKRKLEQFSLLILQLEAQLTSGDLTLLRCRYYLQPMTHCLRCLSSCYSHSWRLVYMKYIEMWSRHTNVQL